MAASFLDLVVASVQEVAQVTAFVMEAEADVVECKVLMTELRRPLFLSLL